MILTRNFDVPAAPPAPEDADRLLWAEEPPDAPLELLLPLELPPPPDLPPELPLK